MKTTIVITAVLTMFLIVGSSGILSSLPKTPPAAKTGAPDEGTCADCHSGAGLNLGPGNVALTFSGSNNQYNVNKFYTVTVTVTDTTEVRYGFQVVPLDDNNNMAGTYKLTDTVHTRTQKDHIGLSRKYINNYSPDYTGIHVWTFKWKSKTNVGNVTFYASGNATDGMDTQTGDNVYTTTLSVVPKPSGLRDATDPQDAVIEDIRAYPNPVTNGHVTVSFYQQQDGAMVSADLLNTQGAFVQNLFNAVKDAGPQEETVYLKNTLTPGIYFIALHCGSQTQITKVLIER